MTPQDLKEKLAATRILRIKGGEVYLGDDLPAGSKTYSVASSNSFDDDELVVTELAVAESSQGITFGKFLEDTDFQDVTKQEDIFLPGALGKEIGTLEPLSASITLARPLGSDSFEVVSTQFTIKKEKIWKPFEVPLDALFSIRFISLTIEVVRPFDRKYRELNATIKGEMTLLGIELSVQVAAPDFLVIASQIGSKEIDLQKNLKDAFDMDLPLRALRKSNDFPTFSIENIAAVIQPGVFYSFSMNIVPGAELKIAGKSFSGLFLAVSCPTVGGLSSQGWKFEANTRQGEGVSVFELIKDLANEVGIATELALPAAVKDLITIESVAVSYNTQSRVFGFECWGKFKLDKTSLDCCFTIEHDPSSETAFGGQILFGSRDEPRLSVSLVFNTSADVADGSVLILAARIPNGLKLSEVVEDLGGKPGTAQAPLDIPEALNPTLTSLNGYLNIKTGDLVLSAEAQSGTKIVAAVLNSGGNKKYAFLIDKTLHLGLSSLPLVGDKIAEVSGKIAGVEDAGIENLQAILTYGLRQDKQGHGSDVKELNTLIERAAARFNIGALPPIPATKQFELQSSKVEIYLQATYFFSDKPQPPVAFPFEAPPPKVDLAAASGTETGQNFAKAKSQAMWLDVQRSFGPVSVKRLGIACVKGEVRLLLDASLAVSSLTMDLQGLSLAFPIEVLTKFNRDELLLSLMRGTDQMSTKLDGLSLTYESGPVAISGGLLKVDPPPQNTRYAYNGELLLKANTWALSAIGSFAQMTNGDSSLFAFAVLNAALGGPAFFFVTGIAAGFGYNRSLRLPTLNSLPDFPLIAASETGNRDKLTTEIDNFIYAAAGQNWLAAGVRFTSFKVMDSFALLTVFFGKRFEVGLLGLATISMPARPKKQSGKQTTEGAVAPIAYAQLALVATYAPDDGVLKIAAQLMPGAYILSEKCRLTGGFALYTWFQDEFERDGEGKLVYEGNTNQKKLVKSGFRAGDFVLSIGGYHPDFTPPAHYPSVPRVGANWRVSDKLTIKGGLYFALTPLAIMAGGSLEANYEDGNLKAWFNSRVDFLLYWEPLSYHANLKVVMGASYTMSWFSTAKTISAQVAVDVELYGPPFGGKANVDLYVCSFTIDFGAKPALPEKLNWSQFEERFLPAASDVCLSRAGGGLVREIFATKSDGSIDGGSSTWVVNSEKFVIVTSSAIPCSVLPLVNGKPATVKNPKAFAPFGVKPCEIPNTRLESEQKIEWQLEGGALGKDVWEIEPITQRLPRAAWDASELRSATQTQSTQDREKLAKTVLNDLGKEQVTDELITGFRLTPKPKTSDPAGRPAPIMGSELLVNAREVSIPANAWEKPDITRTSQYDNSNALSRYGHCGTLADRNMQRREISAALKRREVDVNQNPTTRYLSVVAAKQEFLAAPFISKLGGMQPC